MSATYQQSSASIQPSENPQSAIRNPQSIRRVRLSAEMIRDQALLAAGLLTERLGGPSVKPYQPAGLFRDMTFSNMTSYEHAKGDDLYRRSLYSYWKRTVFNPAMLVFDATAREACTVRETRTNTPLQALNLMNDVTYLEAARLLAERMLKEGGATDDERVAWAFRVMTSRWPKESERATLRASLEAQRQWYGANLADAERLLRIGERRNDAALPVSELAAYTTVASLLLNLDEVITKQ